jgi:hypothetical protein
MNKTQKILIGLVAFQLVLAALVIYFSRPKATSDEALLSDVSIDNISAIQISDNENNQIKIQKVNGVWVLADSDNFPVIEANVTSLVESLANIRTGRLVTNTSGSHKRLEVGDDNYQRKIDVSSSTGDFTLYLGSSPAQSNVHARLAKKDSVYLTNAISTTTANALISNWIDTSLIQIESGTVTQVEVQTAGQKLQFQLNANGEWECLQLASDETLDTSNWNTYLTAFTNLKMVKPVSNKIDESYGLSSPAATLKLTYTENDEVKTGELIIGKQDETDTNYYAKWSGSDYVVKLASFNAERIININKAELISVPATETAAP